MKVRIKSYNSELPQYLTEGKGYEIEYMMNSTFFITTDLDDPEYISISLVNCDHLNGGEWELVE